MAKKTLLKMTQDILSVMESDEVNSIADSVESLQVAEVIRGTYYDMHSNRNWPHRHQLVKLVAYSDSTKPTHMRVDEDFTEITALKYNKAKAGETRKRYEDVAWKNPDDFLRYINIRNNDEDNIIVVVDPTGVELLIKNDQHPTYYTSFDDFTIVFDSYLSSVDTTLQASKIQAMAYVFPELVLDDVSIPFMPVEAFAALEAEARSRCQFWFKDTQDVKSEQEAGRQQRWLSRKDWVVKGGIKFPNYGRSSRKGGRDVTLSQRSKMDT
jgi:hypothetical protein